MKRFGILLAATLTPFFVIGYLFGNLLFKDHHTERGQEMVVQAATITQRNIVYIQIEKIPDQPVRLVSIWALFILPSEQPIATFIRLYPSNNPTRDALLASELVFGNSIAVDQSFNDVMTKYYEINWDRMVILDQGDFEKVINYFEKNKTPLAPLSIQYQDTQNMLQSLCAGLLVKDPQLLGMLSTLEQIGTNFKLPKEDFIAAHKWLSTGKPFADCEVQVP